MGLESVPGLSFLGKIDFAGFFSKASQFILWVVGLVIIGAIIYYFYQKKKYNEQFTIKIQLYEDVRGNCEQVGEDWAMPFVIKGTNVELFFLKSRNIYLPRGTRRLAKNLYAYAKHEGGDYVNFDIISINNALKTAGVTFNRESDKLIHANVNKLLEDKYKNKDAKWWLEYKEIIGLVIMILVLTISIFLIFGKVGDLIGQVTTYEAQRDTAHLSHQDNDKEILNLIQQIKTGTGIIKVG